MSKKINDYVRIEDISDYSSIRIYILKKGTSKELDKRYNLFYSEVSGEALNAVKKTIVEYLKGLENQDFTNYFSYDSYSKHNLYFKQELDKIGIILNKVKQFTNLDPLSTLDENTKAIVIELEKNNKRILFFKSKNLKRFMKKKIRTLLLKNGLFDSAGQSSNILEIEPDFDFIYFEKYNTFLIKNKTPFDSIFDYKEVSQEIVKNSIEHIKKHVSFENNMEEVIITNGNFLGRLVNLIVSGRINDLGEINYINYQKKLNANGIDFNLDKNKKPKVSSENDVRNLLNLLSKNFVEEVETAELYISSHKEKAKKTKKSR